MVTISRRLIKYQDVSTGRDVEHYALIALSDNARVLLSHPNLYLLEKTKASVATSNRYSSIIMIFYNYLSTQNKFKGLDFSLYHVLANNLDIKRWQVSRQVARVEKQSESPSSETIFEDAKLLLKFFHWLCEQGYVTNVKVEMKSWVANFKNSSLLNYVDKKAEVIIIDAKNITVLDKEKRQGKLKSLITGDEIRALIESYSDPVYGAMFKLSLGTAMRPMDLCRFPYIGNGCNKHIMSYADMNHLSKTVDFLVIESKGNKTRTIKINIADLKVLEKHYIKPYYLERRSLYKERYGKSCPPSILFLNKFGEPVRPSMISSRTYDAKQAAMKKDSEFRGKVIFYDARHWWPTMYLVNFFKDKLLTKDADVLYAAAATVLTNQMGHKDISTTYKFYVDMARLLVLAHEGHASEIVAESTETTEDFIERME